MKIADGVRETVWIDGRRQVRLLEVMKEADIPYTDVGFPVRSYHRPGGVTLVVGRIGVPYERIELDLGHIGEDGSATTRPSVISREPIPYVTTYRDLYSYEKGHLMPWSSRRKEQPRALPAGEWVFEVLGRAGKDGQHLRVRLPHRPREEWVLTAPVIWLDRVPTPLELRLQALVIDPPNDHELAAHPLRVADYVLEQARKERWFRDSDGELYGLLAVEGWEERRQWHGLALDEAVVAVGSATLAAIEDHGRTYYSGPLSGEALNRYIRGDWYHREPADFYQQMADLSTIEAEMMDAAMRAVAKTRHLYGREAYAKLKQP